MYGNLMSVTSTSSQTYYGTLADNQKCFEEIWDVWVDNMPDCQTGIELMTNNIISLSTLTYPNKTDWTQGFCGPLYSGALTCDPRCQAMIDKFDSVCTGQTYERCPDHPWTLSVQLHRDRRRGHHHLSRRRGHRVPPGDRPLLRVTRRDEKRNVLNPLAHRPGPTNDHRHRPGT